MKIKARVLYSLWREHKSIDEIQFIECLHYFEHSVNQSLSFDIFNLHSKMKLLFNLSGQR